MRGLFVVLGLGLLKAIYTRLFLGTPSRRDRVKPEAVSAVRLTPEGAGWIYEHGWPRRRRKRTDIDHQ